MDMNIEKLLKSLDISATNKSSSTGSNWLENDNETIVSYSPVDGKLIASVQKTSKENYEQVIKISLDAFTEWSSWPAPKRGEIVRQIGDALRTRKIELGTLVSYEMGKSLQEGIGEVQEMIDICDYATGLSRQLYGMTTHSERPGHRMFEQWHPLGIVGIISAFNFPVAVWSWNAMIALVCGNVCVWKPSEKTPITAIACQRIIELVLKQNNIPEGVLCLINGDRQCGEWLTNDHCVKVCEDADLNIAITACVFGAVGTAGQRCTTTRRLIVHSSIYEKFKSQLINAYSQLKIGNPLLPENHMGPLIDKDAVVKYLETISLIKQQGGMIIVDGGVIEGNGFDSGCYVKPCIAEVDEQLDIVKTETFAPILYLMKYTDLNEAIKIQNSVPQGLSSAIMTTDIRKSELFLSVSGSDCGIANVNIGTSGAEIGGAFGGEKETGGGRESGSDSWKSYMRRQTVTINFSTKLPLAQGISFEL